MRTIIVASLLLLLAAVACGEETPELVAPAEPTVESTPSATGAPATPKPTTTVESSLPTNTPFSPTAESTARPEPTNATMPSTPTPTPTVDEVTNTPTPTATPEPTNATTTWRGLVLAPEDRCSPYDSDDYPYSQSVEAHIVADIGGIYGPYTGRWFDNTSETDIEHIVARSEAHDSGLCAANDAMRREFAADLLNLTLADPSVNRHQKSDKDAAEWLPDMNTCWFADRIVQVRLKYELTVDQAEADALGLVLTGCSSVEMVVVSATESVTPTPIPPPRSRRGRAGAMGRQWQRAHHLRRGAEPWHRTCTPGASGVSIHERRRR